MRNPRQIPTTTAALMGAGVAIAVSMGIAADGSAAMLTREPCPTGPQLATTGRDRVGQWLSRLTHVAREWRRLDPWRGGVPAPLHSAPRTHLPDLEQHKARVPTSDQWLVPAAPLRDVLTDLPPPRSSLLG